MGRAEVRRVLAGMTVLVVVVLAGWVGGAVAAPVAILGAVANQAPRVGQISAGGGTPIAGRLGGVAALSAGNVWAVGTIALGKSFDGGAEPLIVHWNGFRWRRVPAPAGVSGGLSSVAGTSADNLWAVGTRLSGGSLFFARPMILHWNGRKWSLVRFPDAAKSGASLDSVAVRSASDAWAVGNAGRHALILHWNGTNWNQVPVPVLGTQPLLQSVAAVSAHDAWAVGGNFSSNHGKIHQNVLIVHWNGSSWTRQAGPRLRGSLHSLRAVAVGPDRSVWAVGSTFGGPTLIMRRTGAAWRLVPGPGPGPGGHEAELLYALAVVSPRDVWAVGTESFGDNTAIMHWNGSSWTRLTGPAAVFPGFLSGLAAVSAGNIWAVGENDSDGFVQFLHWNGTNWKSVPGPAGVPGSGGSKSQRIKVLTAALAVMHQDYQLLGHRFTPGPVDVFDYQVGDLWKRGIDGTGTTIAVVEGWDSPGLTGALARFDQALGLPAPRIQTIYPTGLRRLPAKCPPAMVKLGSYGNCSAWEAETILDVEAAHLMAPYAKILVTVAPPDSEITDDAASNVAPPEFMEAVEYLATHHLANVISISDGTAESTYRHGPGELTAQDAGELTAAAHGIPVLVGTGDCGAAQHLAVGGPCVFPSTITRTRATAAWDDSPWVTAVGGTIPDLGAAGQRLSPDPLWSSEGAGFSAVFNKPGYQDRVAAITRSRWRSVPDLTMNASDGTSEAGPLLAGVLALATELNHGRNVGPVNTVLYHVLGPVGLKDGIADVVSGSNTVYNHPNGKVLVRGFTAARGFDVASGWGTIRANTFVPALVTATQSARQDAAIRAEAAAALARLERGAKLSTTHVGAGDSTVLTAPGFLPGHPVTVYIDGRKITTLHADGHGSVRYTISPSALGLQPGQHAVDLVSMLIITTNTFHSS